MKKNYTIIYQDDRRFENHATKVIRVNGNIHEIMVSNYGQGAIFIFDGHPLMIDCTELESEVIFI